MAENYDEIKGPPSIPLEQVNEENRIKDEVLNHIYTLIKEGVFPVSYITAPTAFGKTVINLAIGKILGDTLIVCPNAQVIKEYHKTNMKMQEINYSEKQVAFMIGKSNALADMCPHGRECKIAKKNIHNFCDVHKKGCRYNKNMIKDTKQSKYELKEKVKIKIASYLKKINSKTAIRRDKRSLIDLINSIRDLGYCPYYFLKRMAEHAAIIVCDYEYFSHPEYMGPFLKDWNVIIDEPELFFRREKEKINVKLESEKIEKGLVGKYLKKIDIDYGQRLHTLLFDFLSIFLSWLSDKGEGIDEGGLEINMQHEMENSKRLGSCITQFETIKEKYPEFFKTQILEGKTQIAKLLKFFHYRKIFFENTNTVTFVEYITKEDEKNIILTRYLLFLTDFFKRKKKEFKSITFSSATLVSKKLLEIDLGKNINYPTTTYKIGIKEGILFKNEAGNLGTKTGLLSFSEKSHVKPIINIIKASKENAIVVFIKSDTVLRNKGIRNIITNAFEKEGILCYIIKDAKDDEEKTAFWTKHFKISKKRKATMFCSAQGEYSRGVNILEGDNCRLMIIWGKPIDDIPHKIVQNAYSRFLKEEMGPSYTFEWLWYHEKVKIVIYQVVGRLTRGDADFGFFILIIDKNIEKDLLKEIREDMGIDIITEDIEVVIDQMNLFFEQRYQEA